MADSQFAPVESLSVLRLLEPSDVCHKVAEVAAWLNGAVWRVSPQLCACFFFSQLPAYAHQVKLGSLAASDSRAVVLHAEQLFASSATWHRESTVY